MILWYPLWELILSGPSQLIFPVPTPFYSGAFASSKINVSSPADLSGLTVGVTGGTLEDLELTKVAPSDAKITRFGDNAATLSAYTSGQVQVVTGNTAAASLTDADQV